MSLIFRLVSRLSLKTQYRLADIFSLLIALIPNRTQNYTRLNIALCFPRMDAQAKSHLVRSAIRHSSYSLFELAAVWCWPVREVLPGVDQHNVDQAFWQSEKSRIIIAPHIGCWELLNLWLAENSDLMTLYRPLRPTRLDQFILYSRSRNGAQMIPTNTLGLRQMSRGLKQGKTVMILPDQRPRKASIDVSSNFFGHAASTSPLIHKLCSRLDCDVFIAGMFRNNNLDGFDLEINRLEHDRLSGDQQQSLLYLNRQMECLIKKHPEQYQWGYRRFPAELYHQQQIN
ncbi:MAG: hypothetical protein GY820_24805 [Gammaproteobacteria bacterium]|nr:hypothetical protein [Gammaproteobacteria bacterium]